MATARARIGVTGLVIVGLCVAFTLAAFVSPFASSQPDGLERVAEDASLLETGRDRAQSGAPLADYTVPNVDHERAGTGLSGVIGVLITLVGAVAVCGGMRRRVRRRARAGAT
jgi:hypothetical protein